MNVKHTILIVEDQFVEANHLRLMLKKAGYEVLGIARSVSDAKSQLAKETPDMVLLDIYLSGKETGIDLARYLKQENIGFIYLSANSNEETLNAAKATHPYGFLVKPFREKDLFVTLEIARYHQANGLESLLRKETFFQKQIKQLTGTVENRQEIQLKIMQALQQLIPYDFATAVPKIRGNTIADVTGFLRIGYDEYQKIGIEEFQVVSKLKVHELQAKFEEIERNDAIELSTGAAFEAICKSSGMKAVVAKHFGMLSNLTMPIPLESLQDDYFYFSFFSRQANGFTEEHMHLCERLQPALIATIKNLLQKETPILGASLTKQGSLNNAVSSKENKNFNGVIGRSPQLLKVFDFVTQVASSDTTVLIMGESGTGKERIAENIHLLSPRKKQPFIKINCAALPTNLIESELFGHERGAFTGATERRIGRFEQANNGTLFLDEIGELNLDVQAKLLRVLQEKEMERIGSSSSIKVNVRIVTATNRNLEKEVAEGRFRLDLYYRINVFPIQMPPLRDRKEDIVLLVHHFIRLFSAKTGKMVDQISEATLKNLLAYHWPGNIRELENLIERSVLLAKSNVIDDIPLPINLTNKQDLKNEDWYIKTIEENEREHILAVLEKCMGRIRGIGGAAEILGVPPTTLASKIKKLGIKRGFKP